MIEWRVAAAGSQHGLLIADLAYCSAPALPWPPALPPPLLQVLQRFPDPDTPLLVGDADGCSYAVEALELLFEAGYTSLVGLQG